MATDSFASWLTKAPVNNSRRSFALGSLTASEACDTTNLPNGLNLRSSISNRLHNAMRQWVFSDRETGHFKQFRN